MAIVYLSYMKMNLNVTLFVTCFIILVMAVVPLPNSKIDPGCCDQPIRDRAYGLPFVFFESMSGGSTGEWPDEFHALPLTLDCLTVFILVYIATLLADKRKIKRRS
jgi:hypothetical protein